MLIAEEAFHDSMEGLAMCYYPMPYSPIVLVNLAEPESPDKVADNIQDRPIRLVCEKG